LPIRQGNLARLRRRRPGRIGGIGQLRNIAELLISSHAAGPHATGNVPASKRPDLIQRIAALFPGLHQRFFKPIQS
jgi:hypothetical protein